MLLASEDGSPAIAGLKVDLEGAAEVVVARARAAGVVRSDLTATRLQHLVCGVEHAVRIGPPGDREFLVTAMLDGLRVVAPAD